MTSKRQQDVKHAQRESFLHREIASLVTHVVSDDPLLTGLFINRVKLSPDRGRCTVYFFTINGKDDFDQKLPVLILYKPSIRNAVAKAMQSRYTPEIRFAYDSSYDKQRHVDDLIEKLKDEGKL
ncbi:MAG: 30S ribosome-binding factor RbfA [Candidatus Dependentiae bacterium]|nr:30S ribosome-binding factor RbfA [Candidatus Dependentiae bacterium]